MAVGAGAREELGAHAVWLESKETEKLGHAWVGGDRGVGNGDWRQEDHLAVRTPSLEFGGVFGVAELNYCLEAVQIHDLALTPQEAFDRWFGFMFGL